MKNTHVKNTDMNEKDVVVLGVPLDSNSSFLRGPALAPSRIKEALFSESSNLCTEKGYDLGSTKGWHFLPDHEMTDGNDELIRIENSIAGLIRKNLQVITLGGDHSVSIPAVGACAKKYPELNILHFDAHPDLYDELDGSPYSHACPFARIMEQNLVQRLVQVGIRTMTEHQYKQVQRFGVEVIYMENINDAKNLAFDGPVYVSLDMDCLDPAYAPGVSHHEPGGMNTRDVLEVIKHVEGKIVGGDIVEYNPERDMNGVTGMVAGKLLKELIARILEDSGQNKINKFMGRTSA